MKTVMQELLEFVKYKINNDPATEYGRVYSEVFRQVKSEIEDKYLEAEKEQIITFHIEVMKQGLIEEGDKKWSDAYLPKIRETAEHHYTQTFKSDE